VQTSRLPSSPHLGLVLTVPFQIGIDQQTTGFQDGHHDLSQGDYFVWWHRLIVEADATALLPIVHGDSTRQLLGTGMVSVLVSPQHASYPVYVDVDDASKAEAIASVFGRGSHVAANDSERSARAI
jgi:hypothetical protein